MIQNHFVRVPSDFFNRAAYVKVRADSRVLFLDDLRDQVGQGKFGRAPRLVRRVLYCRSIRHEPRSQGFDCAPSDERAEGIRDHQLALAARREERVAQRRVPDTACPFQNETPNNGGLFPELQCKLGCVQKHVIGNQKIFRNFRILKMYSLEFILSAIKLYQHFDSMRKVASVLNISIASISRWYRLFTYHHQNNKQNKSKPRKMSEAMKLLIEGLLQRDPLLTCRGIGFKDRRNSKSKSIETIGARSDPQSFEIQS